MARTVSKVLGFVFLIVGLAGFANPTLMGLHLTTIHNMIHVLTGVVSLYVGFALTYEANRTWCMLFGSVYLVLGILGFVSPELVARVIGHDPLMADSRSLAPDNTFHVVVGAFVLLVGLVSAPSVPPARVRP